MLESVVEGRLKRLESYGFKCLKLRTPGYNGTKDRMILWPTWAPGNGPVMVECKAPHRTERALQEAVREDWRARGCDVRDYIDTIEKADALCDKLLVEAVQRFAYGHTFMIRELPDHIQTAYVSAYSGT